MFSRRLDSAARGSKLLMVSDRDDLKLMDSRLSFGIEVPSCDPFVVPLLYAVPVQLLAYHTAVAKGTAADQPRNLASQQGGVGAPGPFTRSLSADVSESALETLIRSALTDARRRSTPAKCVPAERPIPADQIAPGLQSTVRIKLGAE